MKKIYIAICFLTISISLNAQNNDTKKADKLYKQFEYVAAAKEYLKLAESDKASPYVFKQLAESYFNTFNTVEAAKWYAKAIEQTQDAETYFKYAQMLKANGKYEEANKQMLQFSNKAPNDIRAKQFKENPNYLPKLLAKDKLYNVKALDAINSDKSDFGPLLQDNILYFTSARNKARKNYKWTNEPYIDIYQSTYNLDGTFGTPETVNELNSKFNDGPVTLSKDGNTIYFASESFLEKSYQKDKVTKNKIGQVNLFKATKTGSTWGNIAPLPFNSGSYSTSNPSLSQDGKMLYFSSNMPGSVGGVDIWRVSINSDGSYGTPENLGNKINTEGDEIFPFISDDNKTLFFASSGRPGLGGLDIFQIDLSKPNTEPLNLGKPVNSEKDDFSFSFNSSKNVGFFASNRSGQDDLYQANPICALEVTTVVTNAKTGAILSDAKVSILDDKKNMIATSNSDSKGEVTFKVDCEKAYTIQASKDGFEGNTFGVSKVSKSAQTKVDAPLQPIDVIVTEKEIILKPIYFEFNKSNITQEGAFELDKLVQVMKNNDKIIILAKSHTDNRGSDLFNMNLSERRAKATVQYVISKGIPSNRISGKGYGETELKVDCKENCTEEEHAQNRRSEFIIIK